MAFDDLETKRIERALDAFLAKWRPPPHIRPDLDIGYRITRHSVEILEIRPQWDNRSIIRQYPIAKATYVRTQDHWRIFWMRASLKWQGYEPMPTAATVIDFLTAVDADEYACSWG